MLDWFPCLAPDPQSRESVTSIRKVPSLSDRLIATGNPMSKLLTRKQQWRRTRTRRHSWANLPPELLEAMLAASSRGISKPVPLELSYAKGMKAEPNQGGGNPGNMTQRRQQDREELASTPPDPTSVKTPSGVADPLHLPRSMSCSSLTTNRILFPRSSSRDGLGERSIRRERRGRRILGRKKISFDAQVRLS